MTVGTVRGGAWLLPLLALACGGEANDEDPAQYAVVLRDELGSQRVFSISTLEARGNEELEAARAQGGAEYPASDLLFPWLREGRLIRFPEDRQSFTEIFVQPRGEHQLGGTYSIAELGVQPNEIPFGPIAISREKAYLFNARRQRILVWDLEAMVARATLSLGIEVAAGYTSLAWTSPPVADDQFILVSNSSSTEGVAADTTVTVIDVKTDEVLSQQHESRCTGLAFAYESASGDRYFATGTGAALSHLAQPEDSPAPCVLRIRKGQTLFDPTWQGSLSDAVGSRAWGALSRQVGAGLLLLVAPEPEAQRQPGGWLAAAGAEIWQPWLVQPDGSGARQLTMLSPMSTRVFVVTDAERRYLLTLGAESSEQRYINVTDVDRPRPALSLPARTNAWRIRSLDYLFR